MPPIEAVLNRPNERQIPGAIHMSALSSRRCAEANRSSTRGGLDGVIDSLLFAQHAIEMFRRSVPEGAPNHRLDQLANRLTKILAETRKLKP